MEKASFIQMMLLTLGLFPLWIVALQIFMSIASISTAATAILLDFILS